MLKGIDPILNADVLHALRAMGHGDDLIIADTNFPSNSVARETVLGKALRIDRPAAEVVRAVFSQRQVRAPCRRSLRGAWLGCWRVRRHPLLQCFSAC